MQIQVNAINESSSQCKYSYLLKEKEKEKGQKKISPFPEPLASARYCGCSSRRSWVQCSSVPQQRSSSSLSCTKPLWAVLARAGMSTLWCCPSSISSADPPRCPEGWFSRGCRGVWHARTTQDSVSSQLPEEVPACRWEGFGVNPNFWWIGVPGVYYSGYT